MTLAGAGAVGPVMVAPVAAVVIRRVDRAMGWSAPALSLFRVRAPAPRLAVARHKDCDREPAAVGDVGARVPRQVVVGRGAAWGESGDYSFWKSRLWNLQYS